MAIRAKRQITSAVVHKKKVDVHARGQQLLVYIFAGISRPCRHGGCPEPRLLRYYQDDDYDGRRVGRELFRDALVAIRRRRRRRAVRRLSVLIDSYYQSDFVEDIMCASPGMDAVLAEPAMRRLEELRVELRAELGQTCDKYVLPASRVPCRSLRVLELSGCTLGPPAAGAVFGRLETLKMVSCKSSPEGLQAMLDAAPSLARLWLERVWFTVDGEEYTVTSKKRFLVRCPAATASVAVIHCHWTNGLDVDAPGARSLRYTGYMEHFPFGPAAPSGPPANLQYVQLSFCAARRCFKHPSREMPPHALFWDAIGRFSRVRVLKLELLDISDIAVFDHEEEGVLLKAFPELVFLELEGSHEVDSRGAAVAIANLLLCCPALQEFHLKCKLHGAYRNPMIHLLDARKARLGLKKSMEALKRLKSGKIVSPSSGVGDGDGIGSVDLAALKTRSIPCLEGHLRKIRLEFELKYFDCFEVRLAKFLVENILVLEEMEVHDGDQRVSDHIHRSLSIWRADSSKRKTNIFGEHSNDSSNAVQSLR